MKAVTKCIVVIDSLDTAAEQETTKSRKRRDRLARESHAGPGFQIIHEKDEEL